MPSRKYSPHKYFVRNFLLRTARLLHVEVNFPWRNNVVKATTNDIIHLDIKWTIYVKVYEVQTFTLLSEASKSNFFFYKFLNTFMFITYHKHSFLTDKAGK